MPRWRLQGSTNRCSGLNSPASPRPGSPLWHNKYGLGSMPQEIDLSAQILACRAERPAMHLQASPSTSRFLPTVLFRVSGPHPGVQSASQLCGEAHPVFSALRPRRPPSRRRGPRRHPSVRTGRQQQPREREGARRGAQGCSGQRRGAARDV